MYVVCWTDLSDYLLQKLKKADLKKKKTVKNVLHFKILWLFMRQINRENEAFLHIEI